MHAESTNRSLQTPGAPVRSVRQQVRLIVADEFFLHRIPLQGTLECLGDLRTMAQELGLVRRVLVTDGSSSRAYAHAPLPVVPALVRLS